MSRIESPHIYKKGKSLKLKNLDDNTEKKEYVFSTPGKTTLQLIGNQCNNMNQIVARCWLNTLKINHYFGISKDISKNLSKNKIHFNQFKNDLSLNFKNGEVDNKTQFEKLFDTIEKQNKLIQKISSTIDNNSKNNQFVEEVAKKANTEGILKDIDLRVKDIQSQIKQLIG